MSLSDLVYGAWWAEIPRLWKQNVSTEQENVCYEFLYCVDVVKLPLKFILRTYEVKKKFVFWATVHITTFQTS
jgi:hypothetical protein